MRITDRHRQDVSRLGRIAQYGSGFAVALALALGLMASHAHAWDREAYNQRGADLYQQQMQQESARAQSQWQQDQQRVQQEWARQPHFEPPVTPPVHSYTFRSTTPDGSTRQQFCQSTSTTTFCQ